MQGTLALCFFYVKEDTSPETVAKAIDSAGWQILWKDDISDAQLGVLNLPAVRGLKKHAFLIFDPVEPVGSRRIWNTLSKKIRRLLRGQSTKGYILNDGPLLWEILPQLASNEDIERIKEERQRSWRSMHPQDARVKILSVLPGNSVRSRLELIEIEGRKYIRKLFKPYYKRFAAREIEARKHLVHPAISPLIEYNDNCLIIPYYEPLFSWRDNGLRLYPLVWAREIMTVMDYVSKCGWAMVDWHPGCAVVDKQEGVKLVDFEYAAKVQPEGTPLENSVDYRGIPQHMPIERPGRTNCGYAHMWYPVVGVSLHELRQDPLYKLHLKRAMFMLRTRMPKYLLRTLEKIVKRLLVAVAPPCRTKGDYIVIC